MIITIVKQDNEDISYLIDKLTSKGIKLKWANEMVTIEGKDVHISAMGQIEKRDPKNPFVVLFRKKYKEVICNLINNSHAVLIHNTDHSLSLLQIFFIFYAQIKNKQVYLLNKVRDLDIRDFEKDFNLFEIKYVDWEYNNIRMERNLVVDENKPILKKRTLKKL